MSRDTHQHLAKRLSKSLSYWLRHAPEAAGLHLDADGWADIGPVLAALRASGIPADAAMLHHAVASNDKQRFELSDDGTRIRARQGHSIQVEAGWAPASPPAWLYHGTVSRFTGAILREGLLPQARHHVHLSSDIKTARAVGSRRGAPIILRVAAGRLAEAGGEFFLSTNGVWLIAHVPPHYLQVLD